MTERGETTTTDSLRGMARAVPLLLFSVSVRLILVCAAYAWHSALSWNNNQILLLERGMALGNPVLDLAIKLLRLDKDLRRFRLRRNVGEGVVDRISLSPTGLKIVGVLLRRFTQDQFRAFQRNPVMSDLAHDPISRTDDSHIRSLECSVIRRRESPICRKTGNARVCEVASDERPHVVQFFLGGFVFSGLPYLPASSSRSL